MRQPVYIKMRQRLQVSPAYQLKLRDVAQLSGNEEVISILKDLVVYEVTPKDKTHVVIDVMKVIEVIQSHKEDVEINTVGPAQVIVEIVYEKKRVNPLFFVAVWLLLFFGSGLAIIYFHEDVSMQQVHQRIYSMVTGDWVNKPLVLQIPYSIGLGLGMVLFFNHVFQKRINEEPSPLEVEMFQYQQSLDQYVMMNENRESMKKIEDP
ncbi:stage V sporulation protein AA [Ectobacillus antri]|uniref:Stage V sporulation protein AA n=1 Tax=Ectobacillus antri TaxID=2486280 RepID=A0ABT6H4X8_9BACI|nr:stage V sporulation protein AA [Ectobacillus antri]MDG4655698.1 stage V sporulation protein AA [Ectobacillus antri]MDG5753456.1 stage V sporulation protein AA [Ectobacillus antri]